MNKDQRKIIADALADLEIIKNKIEDIASEEQDKYDNLSEGLQQSERGQKFEFDASTLNDCVSSLEEAIYKLEEIE